MSLPYFPLYPTDFEADTSHLTLAEDGAYNRLLRLMWMTPTCSLPDDMGWILRRMRCNSEADGAVVLGVISEFFQRKGGRIISARLAREYQKTSLAHQKKVAAGSKGGKAKASEYNNKTSSKAVALPKQPEPEPEPEPYREGTKVPLVIVPSKPAPSAFDEFWERYPRKVGKEAARKAFAKAVKISATDDIMFGLSEQLASLQSKETQFIPHASTWLTAGRWTDEPEQPTSNTRNSGPDATTRAITIAAGIIRTPSQDCF